MTRAIAKLIVIGNPMVLKTDDKWVQLMEQSKRLGTRCGAPFPERNDGEMREIETRFKNFKLKDVKRRRR